MLTKIKSALTRKHRETVVEAFGPAFSGDALADDRVDEANHTVKHVKICGLDSVNGRDYRKPVMQKAAAIYEGVPVGVGHVKDATENRNGSYGDFNGFITRPVAEADGFYGDHVYNPNHPSTPQYLWDVRNNPKNLGMSQHADITTTRGPSGRQVVESIDAVHSVDIVNRPATTSGIFESKEQTMQVKLKQIIESADANSRSVLEEMMGGVGMSEDNMVEMPEGADADRQMKSAFRSMVMAAFDDDSLDSKATAAKIKTILSAYDKIKGGDGAAAATGSESNATKESKESADPAKEAADKIAALEAENAKLKLGEEIRILAEESQVKLSAAELKACSALESKEDRAEFVKGIAARGGAVVTSTKPATSSSKVTEAAGGNAPAKPFETPQDVLAYLRS